MRIAIIAALSVVVCGMGAAAHSAKPKTHTVTMASMRFQPEVLTVSAGDTIVWINKDLVSHTATSVSAGFESKSVDPEKTWKHTARKKGEFDYICRFHPTMTGKLRVK